jgi:DNA polymerase III subunit epsilon
MLSTELLAFYRQAAEQNLTIVDLETTGFRPPQSRVTEIAVIQASLQGGIAHQQTTLINSHTQVPDKITEITGITQAMVDSAEPAQTVWPEYWPLLNQGILVAHNIEFDYGFIQAEYRLLDQEFRRPRPEKLCSVIFSRLMLPDLRSRSLPDLVQYFGFDVGRSHRAEADTLACWLLMEHLLTQVQNEDDAVLLKRFGQQWLPLREVAEILGCRQNEAQGKLNAAGVAPKVTGRSGTLLYQRGAVEALLADAGQQLSWF